MSAQGMWRGDAHIKLLNKVYKLIHVLWAEVQDQGPVVWMCDLLCHHSADDLL